ncbi:MAG: carboxypeptidase-like regulatory domain-containing protein [Bacteroidales bacterium]|nr:carboxypeptidase-like regulatory domain-containing protein [Bacteroidales bacterium]
MNFKTSIFFLSFLLYFQIVFGQHNNATAKSDTNRRMIQFSGAVLTADSLKPIRFVNILIEGENRGGAANSYGFFSFVAYTGDVIVFSAQGYQTSRFKIPDTLSSFHYSMYQMMQTDTILLQETVIYPWPTVEALEFAIVNTVVPENDYDRAMKNLERETLREIGLNMPMDGSMNFRNQIGNVVSKSYYNGQYAPISVLNPFAWAQFFKAWEEGKFKRKDKDD